MFLACKTELCGKAGRELQWVLFPICHSPIMWVFKTIWPLCTSVSSSIKGWDPVILFCKLLPFLLSNPELANFKNKILFLREKKKTPQKPLFGLANMTQRVFFFFFSLSYSIGDFWSFVAEEGGGAGGGAGDQGGDRTCSAFGFPWFYKHFHEHRFRFFKKNLNRTNLTLVNVSCRLKGVRRLLNMGHIQICFGVRRRQWLRIANLREK